SIAQSEQQTLPRAMRERSKESAQCRSFWESNEDLPTRRSRSPDRHTAHQTPPSTAIQPGKAKAARDYRSHRERRPMRLLARWTSTNREQDEIKGSSAL